MIDKYKEACKNSFFASLLTIGFQKQLFPFINEYVETFEKVEILLENRVFIVELL